MKLFEINKLTTTSNEFNTLINKHCSQFIKNTKGMEFYRGSNTEKETFLHKHIRQDREPSNTPPLINVFLNALFEKYFNIQNLRNRCLFISPNFHQARRYGMVYQVFLPDNGVFIYNPDIHDLFTYTHQPIHELLIKWGIDNKVYFDRYMQRNVEMADDNYDDDAYRLIHLNGMDTLTDLYQKLGTKQTETILSSIEQELPKLKKYKMTEYTQLESKNVEVMVYGITEYYAKRATKVVTRKEYETS